MLFMVHVMGCIWILLGRKRENGWFTRYSEFTGRSRDSLYPYYASVYFITTTVTTVGYGDILPYENLEILFIMVLELIGLVTFSYILGTFTSVEGSDSAETIIANKQDDIKEFLNKVDQNKSETELPQEIYNSSLENLDLIHDYGVKFVMNLFGFYEQLNPRLRNKFAYANLKNIYIKFIDFFVNKDLHFQSDDKFILRFLSNLECQVFLPNKTIIERGEQLDCIYLIAKGSVHVYSHRQGNLLTVLPKGCFFGDYQIFLDAGSNVSYYASPEEKVFVYTLHKSIFLEICREYENHLDFYMKRALETRKLFKRLIIKNNAFYNPEEQKSSISNEAGSPIASTPILGSPLNEPKSKFTKSIKTNMKAEKMAKSNVLSLQYLAKNITITKYFEEEYLKEFDLK